MTDLQLRTACDFQNYTSQHDTQTVNTKGIIKIVP